VRQGITPGLVSVELFDRVQTILRGLTDKVHQSHALNATFPKFIYRGLLFCADCGQPLYSATTSKQYRYYKCRDYFPHRGGKGLCKAPIMNQEKLEADLDGLFSRQFSRTYFYFELLNKHIGSESRKSAAKRREQLQARQKALTDKRERIIDYGIEGAITKDERDRRLKPVVDEIAANRQLFEDLMDTPLPTYAEWQHLMQPFQKGFAGLPADEKRRLLTSRFQKHQGEGLPRHKPLPADG
jgi:Recombinase zinc beta ribbon domain